MDRSLGTAGTRTGFAGSVYFYFARLRNAVASAFGYGTDYRRPSAACLEFLADLEERGGRIYDSEDWSAGMYEALHRSYIRLGGHWDDSISLTRKGRNTLEYWR